MNEEILNRLAATSHQLHMRSLALSHPNQDQDLASMMQALAITMEAVRSLGLTVNQMNGNLGGPASSGTINGGG